MNLRAALLLAAAPLTACVATDPGGIAYHGEQFANVRLDFNT